MDPFLAPSVECRAALVLGGARSGKSRYAQALAEAAASERLFLATASPGDAEMAARIARHRAGRGAGWRTLEEPLELAAVLRAEAREGRVVLVDCVTLWLSNLLLADLDPAEKIADLVETVATLGGPAVFVSNEVGSGVVPATELGRAFRDWQGRANQELARGCDAVALVSAGLPVLLKPAPRPNLRLR
ncbi:MAG TPA: bifunctional adenosylcobinamide kinase/adenosylcobinamide-phosphate guanylyltransferase [Roseiarcus sp.]|nr:bifunctional adenosylcobinamide kinase/adenosylcobinamide-phosphate guanylyltransferase [Roseiarcus sp.]